VDVARAGAEALEPRRRLRGRALRRVQKVTSVVRPDFEGVNHSLDSCTAV
jgi:hypothetical protein